MTARSVSGRRGAAGVAAPRWSASAAPARPSVGPRPRRPAGSLVQAALPAVQQLLAGSGPGGRGSPGHQAAAPGGDQLAATIAAVLRAALGAVGTPTVAGPASLGTARTNRFRDDLAAPMIFGIDDALIAALAGPVLSAITGPLRRRLRPRCSCPCSCGAGSRVTSTRRPRQHGANGGSRVRRPPALPVAGRQAREPAVKNPLTAIAAPRPTGRSCPARAATAAARPARGCRARRGCRRWHGSCNRAAGKRGQEPSMESTAYIALSRQMVLGRQMEVIAHNVANADGERLQGRGAAARAGAGRRRRPPAAGLRPGHRHGPRPSPGPDHADRQSARPRDRGPRLLHDRDRRGGRATAAAASSALNELGELATAAGDPVLDDGGAPLALPLDGGAITIAADGTVSTAAGVGRPDRARDLRRRAAPDARSAAGSTATEQAPLPARGRAPGAGRARGLERRSPIIEMTADDVDAARLSGHPASARHPSRAAAQRDRAHARGHRLNRPRRRATPSAGGDRP